MDAEWLALRLNGTRAGRSWLARCPVASHGRQRGDINPSLLIFDGDTAVQFRCQSGCHPLDVLAELRRRGLWNGKDSVEGRSRPSLNGDPRYAAELKARREREAREAARLRNLALRIWKESQPALGTEIERVYLHWWRGIEIPEATRTELLTQVLRLHRHCPRGSGGVRQPAMIALMLNIATNAPQSIHRTFLTPQWAKAGKPMMLAPAGGAAVKLTSQAEAFGTAGRCPRLTVCEGVETGLALLMRGECSVWALGSAGGVKRFPILPAVEELVIAADVDARGTGERAAAAVVERWRAAGMRARVMLPEDGKKDFAEGLRL
jgi:Toprim domain